MRIIFYLEKLVKKLLDLAFEDLYCLEQIIRTNVRMSYQTKENFNCLMSFEVTRDFHINIPLTDGYWLDKF